MGIYRSRRRPFNRTKLFRPTPSSKRRWIQINSNTFCAIFSISGKIKNTDETSTVPSAGHLEIVLLVFFSRTLCTQVAWPKFPISYQLLFYSNSKTLFNKQRSLDCALFRCKARRKRLEHERSVGRNTRRRTRNVHKLQLKKCREKHKTTSRFSPHFLSALAASCVL